MTKKAMLTVVAVSVLSGGLVVAASAFAQTTTPGQNNVPSLVQEIADKFHLNTSDVQSVFTQHQQEMQANRETNYENYLANLVSEKKITEEQKELILNKHNQLISQRQSNKNNFKTMTPAEMQDLQNWAKQNNIPLQYLRPFGPGRGFGRFGHRAMTPTPTQ